MAGSFFPGFMDNKKSNRVSRPPGGTTNDIFGLEKRQRQSQITVHADTGVKNYKAVDEEGTRKCLETEDIISPPINAVRKLRRSVSDSRNKRNQLASRTPPLAVGKENLGTHFKGSLSPRVDMAESDVIKVTEESDCEDNDELSTKNSQNRNPITGEIMEAASRGKLEDTTNIAKQEGTTTKREDSEILEQKKPRRPCIRVRQPPGGKSSIIF